MTTPTVAMEPSVIKSTFLWGGWGASPSAIPRTMDNSHYALFPYAVVTAQVAPIQMVPEDIGSFNVCTTITGTLERTIELSAFVTTNTGICIR